MNPCHFFLYLSSLDFVLDAGSHETCVWQSKVNKALLSDQRTEKGSPRELESTGHMAEKEELGKLTPTSYVKTAGLTSKLYLYGSNPKEHIKDFENLTKENTIVQGEIYLAM